MSSAFFKQSAGFLSSGNNTVSHITDVTTPRLYSCQKINMGFFYTQRDQKNDTMGAIHQFIRSGYEFHGAASISLVGTGVS